MNWIQSSKCNSQACVQWAWTESSYCDTGACIQWAWTKSSHCYGSDCVEWAWTESSHCYSSNCVEVAQDIEIGLLRDSKDPDGPVLQFPRQAVREFLAAIKCGQFDR